MFSIAKRVIYIYKVYILHIYKVWFGRRRIYIYIYIYILYLYLLSIPNDSFLRSNRTLSFNFKNYKFVFSIDFYVVYIYKVYKKSIATKIKYGLVAESYH